MKNHFKNPLEITITARSANSLQDGITKHKKIVVRHPGVVVGRSRDRLMLKSGGPGIEMMKNSEHRSLASFSLLPRRMLRRCVPIQLRVQRPCARRSLHSASQDFLLRDVAAV